MHGAFAGHKLIQARADQLLTDLQDLGCLAGQVRLSQVAVPVVGAAPGLLEPAKPVPGRLLRKVEVPRSLDNEMPPAE